MKPIKIVFAIVSFLFSLNGIAQEVKGVVKSYGSNEPIPFANVWVKGSWQGVMADENGSFVIQKPLNDTLYASFVGYERKEYIIKKNENSFVEIFLQENTLQLGEIVVRPKIEFAQIMFN